MRNKLQMAAVMDAVMSAVLGSAAHLMAKPKTSIRRERKPYPTMVTSTPEEIAEHNAAVTTRQVLRSLTKPWKGPSNKANWMSVMRANK